MCRLCASGLELERQLYYMLFLCVVLFALERRGDWVKRRLVGCVA